MATATIIGAINCFYDVTARKETEETLRDSDRRKSEFLAMLAHELRNPLAPILNSLAVMRRARKLESSSSPNAATLAQWSGQSRPAPPIRLIRRWMLWTGKSDKW